MQEIKEEERFPATRTGGGKSDGQSRRPATRPSGLKLFFVLSLVFAVTIFLRFRWRVDEEATLFYRPQGSLRN